MKNSQKIMAHTLFLGVLASTECLAQEPIKIGVVTPLSGTYAGVGQPVRWGLELAAREINESGGVGNRKVVLIFEDEEANPSVAVQKAERLFQVEKVDFLTGMVNSGSTLAVGQLGERNNKLVSTTVSFADSITGDKCSPNVIRVNARAEQQSNALTYWLGKEKARLSRLCDRTRLRNGTVKRGCIQGRRRPEQR
ncbi:ABC transporter substrate-binding protein [Bradyrhizobium sp. RDT10]